MKVTHLIILGDKLITKVFFSINWWRPNCSHHQEVQGHLLEVSFLPHTHPHVLSKSPGRERNGKCDQSPKRTQAGFAIVLTAATEPGPLSLVLPQGSILPLATALNHLVPCPEIPRLGLGTNLLNHVGSLGIERGHSKDTVCFYSGQGGLEASFDK